MSRNFLHFYTILINKSYMGYPTSSRKLNFTHNTVILILGDYNSADKFQSNKLT